jgi:outer membrane protein
MVVTMKIRISLFFLLILVAGYSHAELKIGYVDLGKVMEKSPQAAKAKTRLENEFSSRIKTLKSQGKELQNLEDKLNKDAAIMSEEERRKLEKDVLDKRRDAARAQQELSEDMNLRRNEEMGNLQKHLFEVVKSLAKEESYDLLITDVLYVNEQLDVTNRVLQKLETIAQ